MGAVKVVDGRIEISKESIYAKQAAIGDVKQSRRKKTRLLYTIPIF
jgi:hypothetical protein